MKEKLTHNLDLKILALVFAVILWLIVVNIDDPVKSVQFSGIEVQILHASELEKQGLCYEVVDNTNYVDVTISGRRSVIEEISEENISATADMKDLSSMNTISIKVTSNKSPNDLDTIKASSENVKLDIEELMTISKRIQVETAGTPEDDYILGTRSIDLNQVEISGPKSIVSTIESAKATVDVTGVSSSISASVPIYLYNIDGERIESSRVAMNIRSVSVTQEILFSKDVPIEYEFTGEPEEGYALTDEILTDHEEVKICGKKSVLDNISTIFIRGEQMDVTGEHANKTVEINLRDYLPTNVDFADKTFDGKVVATVLIRRETYTIITPSIADVAITGVPEGRDAEIVAEGDYVDGDKLKIRLYGLSEYLGEVDENNIKVTLDMAAVAAANGMDEIGAGTYHVVPSIDLPEGVHLEDGCAITVRVY